MCLLLFYETASCAGAWPVPQLELQTEFREIFTHSDQRRVFFSMKVLTSAFILRIYSDIMLINS